MRSSTSVPDGKKNSFGAVLIHHTRSFCTAVRCSYTMIVCVARKQTNRKSRCNFEWFGSYAKLQPDRTRATPMSAAIKCFYQPGSTRCRQYVTLVLSRMRSMWLFVTVNCSPCARRRLQFIVSCRNGFESRTSPSATSFCWPCADRPWTQ